jgi:putative SOS response-associated peptidase YedK
MCGRYTVTDKKVDDLTARFNAILGDTKEKLEDGVGRYNVAPSQQVPAVVTSKEGERELRLLKWGLIPVWADDPKVGYRMINARADKVADSRAYGPLIKKPEHRALLVADGYIEWTKPEKKDAPKQPFIHRVDDGALFAFPALWTRSKIEDEWIASVTLITTDANEVARQVHTRMPVILPGPDEEELWLRGELDDVVELLKPIEASRLSVAPANPALNKPGEVPEGPELLVAPAG